MAEPGTRRGWWRDFALILLPAAYTVGFLSWSIHQGTRGLGFHPLSVPQYLVAGVPVLLITVCGGLLRAHMASHGRVPRSRLLAWSVNCLWDVLLYGFIAWLVFSILASIGLLVWTPREMGLAFLTLILLMIGFRVVWPTWMVVVSILERDGADGRRSIRPDRQADRTTRFPFARAWRQALAPTIWVFSILVLLNGHVILGETAPEFGGGAPRAAYLDLDPSQVHESWHVQLFDGTRGTNETVARTVEVEVHLRTPDFILFRTADEPARSDRLYDISSDAVKGIVWLS